jgi:HlyD family secretion protein
MKSEPKRFAAGRLPAALALLLMVGCQSGPKIETVTAKREPISESFREPAKTRLAKIYPVTLPVAARIHRIELEPGDAVRKGQPLVTFDLEPFTNAVEEAGGAVAELESRIRVKDDNRLENTTLNYVRQAIEAVKKALQAADQQVKAEAARTERADKRRQRLDRAFTANAVSRSEVDDARLHYDTANIEWRKQIFYREALNAYYVAVQLGPKYINEYLGQKKLERGTLVEQLNQAKARLARARHNLKLADVRSPIDGIVLARHEQGDRTLPAGQPLLVVGNLDQLEVVAEVLSQDALRLKTGARVMLEPGAGMDELEGEVRRIEPQGFTKLSSLGVEQQRVKVIVALKEKREGLGVGYRLHARFSMAARAEALIVPRFSVLQAPDESFYVFRVVDGRLAKTPVRVGLRNDLNMEIVKGLNESEVIVRTPDAKMKDGQKVSAGARKSADD